MTNPTIPIGTPYKDTFSIVNSRIVLDAVRKRFPDWADRCEPYVNVLTLKAWNRRGYRVRKGEKAITLFTQVPVTRKNERTGEEEQIGTRTARAHVFALPQVERRDLRGVNTHFKSDAASGDAWPSSADGTSTPSPGTSTGGTSGTTSASSTP